MNRLNSIIGKSKSGVPLFLRLPTVDDIDDLVELINFSYRGTSNNSSDSSSNSSGNNETSNQTLGWTNETHYITGSRVTNASLTKDFENMQADSFMYFILEVRDDESSATTTSSSIKRKPIASIKVERDGNKAFIGTFSVLTTMQSSGVGGIIFKFAENFIKEQWKCDEIYLHVVSIRKELLKWYYSLGYEDTNNYSPFFNPDDPTLPFINDIQFIELKKSI